MGALLAFLFPNTPASGSHRHTVLSVRDGEDLLDMRRETLETLLTLLEQHPTRPLGLRSGTARAAMWTGCGAGGGCERALGRAAAVNGLWGGRRL